MDGNGRVVVRGSLKISCSHCVLLPRPDGDFFRFIQKEAESSLPSNQEKGFKGDCRRCFGGRGVIMEEWLMLRCLYGPVGLNFVTGNHKYRK